MFKIFQILFRFFTSEPIKHKYNSARITSLYTPAHVRCLSYVIPSLRNHHIIQFDVCLSVHRCIYVEKKNQLDATEWFIALIICSTSFGHFYAHHQELEPICVLLPPMVCDALVAGCWKSGAGQPAMRSG